MLIRRGLREMRMRSVRIVGAMVLLLSICGCTCISLPLINWDRELEETVVFGKGRHKILLVDISGTISSKEKRGVLALRSDESHISRVREELTKAAQDSRIKGVILRINSPGGTVTASDIIYNEIIAFKETTKIPVVAALMELATSGGYYVALAADRIIAHPTSVIGSIGVIALKINAQGLMEKIGIVDETFTAGDKKDLFSPLRPASEEERDIIQTMLNHFHRRFKDLVLKGRRAIAADEVERVADGRVFTAAQALQHKLIDDIGYLDDAVTLVRQMSGIREAKVIMYHRPWSYKHNIYSQMRGTEGTTVNVLQLDLSSLLRETGLHFMYLWAP